METPNQISAALVAPQDRKQIWLVDLDGAVVAQNRTLKVHENDIRVTLSSVGGTGSVESKLYMPDVVKAAGKTYFIYLDSDGDGNDLVLNFPDGAFVRILAGTEWSPDYLTVDDDCVLLLSTGTEWIMLIDYTN